MMKQIREVRLSSKIAKIRAVLQTRRMGQFLTAVASFSGGLALMLGVAFHFGLIPVPPSLEKIETTAAQPQMAEPSEQDNQESEIQAKSKRKNAEKKSDSSGADPDLVALLGKLVAYNEKEIPAAKRAANDPEIPEFDRDQILNDYDDRISPLFEIPDDLRDRVGFWFDVYTKYDSNRRVIHHARYPWIIYKVVDVSWIINSDTPRIRWLRNERADKFVKEEANKIRAAIRSVSKKTSLKNLDEYEQMVVDALGRLDGSVQKRAAQALSDVRVQTGQRNFFIEGLEVSPRYLGTMEKIFKEHKLPVELTRIPFVESSFNKHATSKVGATGIWQFMGSTGRKFMRVDETIDERRSPFKATEGAARLLKENHMILYRSWPLAVTAWNHGPGGIRKASQVAGSRELGTIVARYSSKTFDFASSNFYAEFLAALHAERYNKEVYGEVFREPELDLHVVKLSRQIRPSEIVRVSGMSPEKFLMLNPELSRLWKIDAAIPSGFRIHVPRDARLSIENLLAFASFPGQKSVADERQKL